MRKPSPYLSPTFLAIWEGFSVTILERSANDYFSNVCQICDFLQKDFLDISSHDAQAFFDYLIDKKTLKLNSLNAKLASLRSISAFILKQNGSSEWSVEPGFSNVFYNVRISTPSNYVDINSIPSRKEIDFMLDAFRDDDMLYLVLSLVLKCALTVSQICNLKYSQIAKDGGDRGCIVFNYQTRTRYTKIPADVMDLISAYHLKHGGESYVFLNKRNSRISARTLERLFQEQLSRSGINKSFTLQDMRNASIALMLHGGATQSDVAEYIGVSERWMFRFNEIIKELDHAACDHLNIKV